MMKYTIKMIILTMALMCVGCTKEYSKPLYVTTNNCIADIVRSIVGTNAEVINLLSPGVSPHTYSPKPGDIIKAENAQVMFYIADNMDSWAVNLKNKNRIQLINLVPKDYLLYFDNDRVDTNVKHGQNKVVDPHFWTDPMTVKALIPALVDTLSKMFPQYAQTYRNNGLLFMKRLDLLNRQVTAILSNKSGKTVFLFHPSFRYFLKRYKLNYGGAIEESPGKEPTAIYIASFCQKIKSSDTHSIYYEPQFPKASAKAIAESASVLLYMLDPVGGIDGRTRYSDVILYNAQILQNTL